MKRLGEYWSGGSFLVLSCELLGFYGDDLAHGLFAGFDSLFMFSFLIFYYLVLLSNIYKYKMLNDALFEK